MTNLFQMLSKPSPTNEAPPPSQAWRNDVAMLATLLFALFLGVGVRNQSLNASQYIDIGENMPRLNAPLGWLTKRADSGMLQVRNPAAKSILGSEVDVVTRPLEADESLEQARLVLSLQRSRDLQNYRELSAMEATVRPSIGRVRSDATPALLTTYAYVADPSVESGANGLPVVVQAQDLLFVLEQKVYVVTLAADATQWDSESTHFKLFLDSLGLHEIDQNAVEGSVQQ